MISLPPVVELFIWRLSLGLASVGFPGVLCNGIVASDAPFFVGVGRIRFRDNPTNFLSPARVLCSLRHQPAHTPYLCLCSPVF